MTEVGPEGENYPAQRPLGRARPRPRRRRSCARSGAISARCAGRAGERAREDIAAAFSLAAVGEIARARLRAARRVVAPRPPRATRPRRRLPPALLRGTARGGIERADAKLSFDPRGEAARRGGPVGLARRALLQAMRPYTYHQDELNDVVVNALRDVGERLDDMGADVRRLLILGDIAPSGASRADLARVLEGARARPGSTHPAISHFDDKGQRVAGLPGRRGVRRGGLPGLRGHLPRR